MAEDLTDQDIIIICAVLGGVSVIVFIIIIATLIAMKCRRTKKPRQKKNLVYNNYATNMNAYDNQPYLNGTMETQLYNYNQSTYSHPGSDVGDGRVRTSDAPTLQREDRRLSWPDGQSPYRIPRPNLSPPFTKLYGDPQRHSVAIVESSQRLSQNDLSHPEFFYS